MRRTRRNRTKNSTKLGLLFITLLISLACVGTSYSHWSENLYIQCTARTGEWEVPGKTINLPTTPVNARFYYPPYHGGVEHGNASYWDVKLSGIPAGDYNVQNNVWYDDWCVNLYNYTYDNQTVQVILWSSLAYTNPSFPSSCLGNIGNAPNGMTWPCVNYIINHKGNANKDQIQAAIWYFIDGGVLPPPGSVARGLVDNATNNVQTWYPNYPQHGDIVAVLLYTPIYQRTFIEVDP